MRKILLALLAAFGAAAFAVPFVAADPFTEPAFYNGQLVHFLLPSASSANPNEQVVADCFRVGPQVPDSVVPGATAYIMLIPGASQETQCSTDGRPAGPLTHNHVFSKAPGDPGYNAHFQLVLVGTRPQLSRRSVRRHVQLRGRSPRGHRSRATRRARPRHGPHALVAQSVSSQETGCGEGGAALLPLRSRVR